MINHNKFQIVDDSFEDVLSEQNNSQVIYIPIDVPTKKISQEILIKPIYIVFYLPTR